MVSSVVTEPDQFSSTIEEGSLIQLNTCQSGFLMLGSCVFDPTTCPRGQYAHSCSSSITTVPVPGIIRTPMCKDCPAGYFYPASADSVCDKCDACPVNTIANLPARTSCSPCTNGSTRSLTAQSSCVCNDGFINSPDGLCVSLSATPSISLSPSPSATPSVSRSSSSTWSSSVSLTMSRTPSASPSASSVVEWLLGYGEMTCVVEVGEWLGNDIDCSDVCKEVCLGLEDCPCNANGNGKICWVPRENASRICESMETCDVMSYFTGPYYLRMPHYEQWVHLGTFGMGLRQSAGFSSVRCTKPSYEDRKGCYACESSNTCTALNSTACELCYLSSHGNTPTRQDFCESRFHPRDGSPCAECSCCNFQPKKECGYDTEICYAVRDKCSSTVLEDIKGSGCPELFETMSLGKRASVPEICKCLRSASQSLPALLTHDKFDCRMMKSLIPTVRELSNTCVNIQPCSNADDCEGCKEYLSEAKKWSLLHNTSSECSFHPELRKCVVSRDGLFEVNMPCRTSNNTRSSHTVIPWSLPTPTPLPATRSASPSPSVTPSSRWFYDGEDVRGRQLEHLEVRGQPMWADRIAPSPSPFDGTPIPTDFVNTTIGASITHRNYMDARNNTVYIAIPCFTMPDVGFIHSWSLYAGRPGIVHAQVLRRRPLDKVLEAESVGDHVVTAFEIVGENILRVSSLGVHNFSIVPSERIHVKQGDILGFYSPGMGVISWSRGGGSVLYRYGAPNAETPAVRGEKYFNYESEGGDLLFVGNGLDRTYSIACTGRFGDSFDEELGEVVPDHPISLNKTTSQKRRAPSSPCSFGPRFICASITHAAQCGLSVVQWNDLCNRTLVVEKDSCDELRLCPAGHVEKKNLEDPSCFRADRDCEPIECSGESCAEVWREAIDPYFNSLVCPYCKSGADWEGFCRDSTSQSPISIEWEHVDTDPSAFQFFETHYNPVTAMLVNRNNALEIRAPFGHVLYDSSHFIADTVVIRAPAEHQIEGAPKSAMEVQIIHRERYSSRTVILAVLFDEDSNGNSIEMAKILSNPLPHIDGSAVKVNDFDLNEIVDSSKPMLWYNGSLTVPPCSEPVLWGIQMGANSRISTSQAENINSLWSGNEAFAGGRGNNRRVQPLYGRRMLLRSNCGTTGAIACPRSSQPTQSLVETDVSILA